MQGPWAHVVEFHGAAPFWAVHLDETIPWCLWTARQLPEKSLGQPFLTFLWPVLGYVPIGEPTEVAAEEWRSWLALAGTPEANIDPAGWHDGLGWVRCSPTAPNGSPPDHTAAPQLGPGGWGRWGRGPVSPAIPFPGHAWMLAAWLSAGAVNGPCFPPRPMSREWRQAGVQWVLEMIVEGPCRLYEPQPTSSPTHTSRVAGAVSRRHIPLTGEGTECCPVTDETHRRAGQCLFDSEPGALSGIAGASWAGRGEKGPTGMSQEGTKRPR